MRYVHPGAAAAAEVTELLDPPRARALQIQILPRREITDNTVPPVTQ
jgi:hypothetical protein